MSPQRIAQRTQELRDPSWGASIPGEFLKAKRIWNSAFFCPDLLLSCRVPTYAKKDVVAMRSVLSSLDLRAILSEQWQVTFPVCFRLLNDAAADALFGLIEPFVELVTDLMVNYVHVLLLSPYTFEYI